MVLRLFAVVAVGVVLLTVSKPMFGHHSAANYDTDKQIELQGTVTDFKFANPHPLVYFQVKGEDGNVVEWVGESASPPPRWYNSGWRANALQPGDAITISGNPMKDGGKMLRIRKIVHASGKVWNDGAQRQ